MLSLCCFFPKVSIISANLSLAQLSLRGSRIHSQIAKFSPCRYLYRTPRALWELGVQRRREGGGVQTTPTPLRTRPKNPSQKGGQKNSGEDLRICVVLTISQGGVVIRKAWCEHSGPLGPGMLPDWLECIGEGEYVRTQHLFGEPIIKGRHTSPRQIHGGKDSRRRP